MGLARSPSERSAAAARWAEQRRDEPSTPAVDDPAPAGSDEDDEDDLRSQVDDLQQLISAMQNSMRSQRQKYAAQLKAAEADSQQLREQTNAFPALGESTAAKAKGSWCAPVHAVASKVDVAKDFPTLGGGAKPAQPSRAQRRWGAAGKGKAGRSGPLTMAMIMESR